MLPQQGPRPGGTPAFRVQASPEAEEGAAPGPQPCPQNPRGGWHLSSPQQVCPCDTSALPTPDLLDLETWAREEWALTQGQVSPAGSQWHLGTP